MEMKESSKPELVEIDNNVPLLVGYSFTSLLIGAYFIIKAIKDNYFDCIFITFVGLPYTICDLMVGLKQSNKKKIIINSLLSLVLVAGAIFSLVRLFN